MKKINNPLIGGRKKATFRVIKEYLRIYKKETIALSVFAIISALGNGTIPYILGRFFDSLIKQNETFTFYNFSGPLFIGLIILWLVIQIITSLTDWKIATSSSIISEKIWSDYMAKGIGRILLLPVSFHNDNNSSSLVHRLDMAASAINTILSKVLINLTPKFLSIIVSLIVCYFISPILLLILLVGLIIFSIIMIYGIKPLAGFQKEFWERMNQVWDDFSGVLDNTKTIKLSATEEYEQNRLSDVFNNWLLPSFIKKSLVKINIDYYQRFIIVFTQFTIFIFSIALVYKNQISIGDLLAFNAYTALVFGPLVELGYDWRNIIGGMVDIFESEKILSTPTEKYKPENFVKLDTIKGNVSFKDVSFHYDEKAPVLKNISFEAKEGEVVALVGESGGGKTTLIDMISGHYFPITGNISIDAVPIEKIDLNFLRKHIGIVSQEVVLFNDTIKKNVSYGNFDVSEEELMLVAEKTGIKDFIEKFPQKWESLVGERGVKLSVGQKQRVAIARAMLRKPKILILDEPTSALDAGSEKVITDSIEELMKGKTTFVIAHRLSTVKRANIILVFKNGEIIERGVHDELVKIKGGEYKRLYDLQIGLYK